MNRNRKAFLLALVLYLPLLIALWEGQKRGLLIPKPATNEGGAIPLHYFQHEEPSASVIESTQEAIHPPADQPAPPEAATEKSEESESEESEEAPAKEVPIEELPTASDAFAPKPLSDEELNRAFEASSEPSTPPRSPPQPPTIDGNEIDEVYGDLLHDLSDHEREFIEKSLEGIGRITQRYLRYPDLAGRLRMSGEVILAFTLLPDGDITPIEVQKSSGYSLLDDNAIRTVEIAHKDYPHPDEPVRIRLRVIYRLY